MAKLLIDYVNRSDSASYDQPYAEVVKLLASPKGGFIELSQEGMPVSLSVSRIVMAFPEASNEPHAEPQPQ